MLTDQLAKLWITRNFDYGQSEAILGQFLYITHIRNPGGAFGLLANQPVIFLLGTVLLLGLVYFILWPTAKENSRLRLGLVIGLGGALGNFIDRIRYGLVIDFIDIGFWPVFNIADVAIVVGVGLLFWEIIKGRAG